MKRILAAFEKKAESLKKERQIKRAYRAIDIAKDNALDQIESLENKKSQVLASMVTAIEYDCILQHLADLIGEQEEQQRLIERLDKVKAYLEEDVEVEEEK